MIVKISQTQQLLRMKSARRINVSFESHDYLMHLIIPNSLCFIYFILKAKAATPQDFQFMAAPITSAKDLQEVLLTNMKSKFEN